MKTNVLKYLFLFQLTISLNFISNAQSISFDEIELKKINLRKGIPYFKDSISFESFYTYLTQLEDQTSVGSKDQSEEEDCSNLNPLLKSYENIKGYTSLRQIQNNIECLELEQNKSPQEMTEPIIGDPVLASLINAEGLLWIDETIFYFKDSKKVFVIDNDDHPALESINEHSYHENPNVRLFNGDMGEADFEYYVQENGSVSFTFNGLLSNEQTVHWDFGDGNTGTGKNVIHSYAEDGNYNVCVSIKAQEDGQQITVDKNCKQINLEDEEPFCFFSIHKDQGEDGKVCFSLKGYGGMYAVSADWDFGDGNNSENLTPCHSYYCNKKYTVTVKGVSNTGCTFSRTKKVSVTSFDCCDALASKTQTAIYGQSMLKVRLHQLPLPIIGRTIVSSRHYKRKNNRYKRSKALIKNTINGNVYLSDEQNCKCEHPIYMNQVEQKYKSWLITNYKVGKYFQAKREDLWYGKVYINGSLRFTGAVNTSCN